MEFSLRRRGYEVKTGTPYLMRRNRYGVPGIPRVLYNNLDNNEDLALAVHEKVVKYRPDNWKGNIAKELVIKSKLLEVLGNESEVERIFPIVKKQDEY